MYVLLLLLLPPLVGLIVVLLVATWGANNLVENFVGKKHRLLEEIITTGEIPEDWRSDFTRTQRRFPNKGTDSDNSNEGQHLPKEQAKTRRQLLRRLDKLTRYAKTTPLVADEETRQVLLIRLGEIRADWSTQDLPEF